MPSEHKRRKDDTWTSDELNRALKGTKDEMPSQRRTDGDGERRHRTGVNGSERREENRQSHRRDEEEKSSRRHKDRGDSAQRDLTEEDRERLRQERRAKREGPKEEKKRPKGSKPSSVLIDDDDGDRHSRRRNTDVDRHSERRHKEEEPRRHREERESERRHGEKSRDSEGRHKEERDRRREEEDREKRRHHREGDSRSHGRHDNGEHHDSRDRRKHQKDDDDEEERERRRQERREKRDKEKQKEESHRDRDGDRDRGSHRRKDTSDYRDGHKDRDDHRDSDRHRKHRSDRDVEKSRSERREEPEDRKSDRHRQETTQVFSVGLKNNQKEEEENEDNEDDNYEEDFEDYEDDFEAEDDPEMKEEGEMEEVLRALDEENNRLVSTSRRSNWSDSTELSDERFKEEEPAPRGPPRGKTVINFVSAKQRVMDHSQASKARKRFDDLSKLIELDVAKYDMFDLQPVKEYELYIRSFGRSDTRQAYVQTHDDDIDRDVQTEEIESLSKWTQHPPEEDTAVGGEGISVEHSGDDKQDLRKADPHKLNLFLDRVGQFLFTILDEESQEEQQQERKRDGRSTTSFSSNVSQLGMPGFLTGRHVVALSFCQSEPNSLVTVHSLPFQESQAEVPAINSLSLMCVWNISQPAYPYRICGCEMQIHCVCFSPIKASLLFGGMEDGSVALWDLREPASQHRTLVFDGHEHLVRFPTYNTAGVIEAENHHSPVVSIVPVYSSIVGSLKDEDTTESSSGLSFQLASVEEKATVNLWVVAEIGSPDPAGSETDLGLSPNGKIKLMRSSAINISNPNKYLSTSLELRALDLQLNPGDLNHFYVATDVGCIVHGVRFGNRVFPQSHSSVIDSPVPIACLDFSPFGRPYFLAGCDDGTLHLFNAKIENPLATWREFVSGEKIISVRWSRSRPAVFFVLDNNSTIFTFDLVENGLAPIRTDRIATADATKLEVGGDPNLLTPGQSRPTYMVVALDTGAVEVMTVSDAMRQQQPLEEDFLASYLDRY